MNSRGSFDSRPITDLPVPSYTHHQWLQFKRGNRPWRTVPPIEYRLDLIRVVHDALGHASARATSKHLGDRVLHVDRCMGIERDVAHYIRDCDSCQKQKAPRQVKQPHPFDLYGAYEHVLMDSCGPLELPPDWNSSSSGGKGSRASNKPESRKAWIIIMVDYLTKVAELGCAYPGDTRTLEGKRFQIY